MWRPGALLPGRAPLNSSVPFAFQHAAERRDHTAAAPTLAIISLYRLQGPDRDLWSQCHTKGQVERFGAGEPSPWGTTAAAGG